MHMRIARPAVQRMGFGLGCGLVQSQSQSQPQSQSPSRLRHVFSGYRYHYYRAANNMTTQASSNKIGTHDGTFHCDEALACFMLKQIKQYKNAEIVRSRDAAVLDTCSIIVDVGGVYDASKGRYDHHQRGFTETLDAQHTMKLSSAGLIYKHYGREVIANLTGAAGSDIDTIFFKIYTDLIESLDGIDNGVNQYPPELKPVYRINTDLSARVGRLNLSWNEPETTDLMPRFHAAMEMAGKELVDQIMNAYKSWLPARQIVNASLGNRESIHPTGEIMVLTQYTVWKSHLFDLESEHKIEGVVKYVLYQDYSKSWRVQAVPIEHDSFQSRLPLPEPWRGIRDADLSTLSGIPDTIFVHASGFIGGVKTYESALAMAKAALTFPNAAKKQKTDA